MLSLDVVLRLRLIPMVAVLDCQPIFLWRRMAGFWPASTASMPTISGLSKRSWLWLEAAVDVTVRPGKGWMAGAGVLLRGSLKPFWTRNVAPSHPRAA